MTSQGAQILDGAYLRATLFNAQASRIVITFSYREKGRKDFTPATMIRHAAERGFAQLAITSRYNDWFINPDTAALEDVLGNLGTHYRSRHMLGFSMGGYGAFRFARAAGAHYATAISPQFSIHPDAVPFDRRFRAEAKGFDPVAGDLATHAKSGLQGIIVVDPFRPLDLANARMIHEVFPRVRMTRLGFGGHPATGVLRRAGRAGIIQRTALDGPPRPAPILDLHRKLRRFDEVYRESLDIRLLER